MQYYTAQYIGNRYVAVYKEQRGLYPFYWKLYASRKAYHYGDHPIKEGYARDFTGVVCKAYAASAEV